MGLQKRHFIGFFADCDVSEASFVPFFGLIPAGYAPSQAVGTGIAHWWSFEVYPFIVSGIVIDGYRPDQYGCTETHLARCIHRDSACVAPGAR